MSENLDSTGERMIPEDADAYTFWEHIYRYRFALPFARGRRVLDIACGAGYGAAALAKAGAASVVGVDIDPQVCAYVTCRYGIPTKPGSAESIPLPAESIDVVVSFETIEHVSSPRAFIDECRRVLVPGGTLVISTPNREAYHRLSPDNPYHRSELSADEFAQLMRRGFSDVCYHAQRRLSAPWWNPCGAAADAWASRKIPGVGRLLHSLRLSGGVPATAGVDEKYRRDPVAAIFREPGALATRLVDPYAIHRCSARQARNFVYTIVVAQRA